MNMTLQKFTYQKNCMIFKILDFSDIDAEFFFCHFENFVKLTSHTSLIFLK